MSPYLSETHTVVFTMLGLWPGTGKSTSNLTYLADHKGHTPEGCSGYVSDLTPEPVTQVRVKYQTGTHSAFYNLIPKVILYHWFCVLLVIQTNPSTTWRDRHRY